VTGWQWLALAGLGAFHGLNPGMGWLFAVAIGLQERSRAAMLRALPPIAAGHAASVLIVAGLVGVFQSVLATRLVAIGGGVVLVGFGLWRALSKRHFRWAGMRLSPVQLISWSFLMSSIHGAGLMLLPVLVAGTAPAGAHHHGSAAGAHDQVAGAGATLWTGLAATTVHTVAMVAVAGAVAVVVYEIVGLRILRTAWVNLDRVWAYALVGAGVATVALAVS
jgi:hypothetical protein